MNLERISYNRCRIFSQGSNMFNNSYGFSIEIDNYGYKNTFFQSLYIKVKKNNELISQKKIIDNIFNCQTSFFSPHISLYYGHKNNSVKKKIISNLPKLKKTIKVKNLCLALNKEKKAKWKIIETF